MDYTVTYLNTIVCYYTSGIVRFVDSNTYLVLPKAKSRIAGYYYLMLALPALEQTSSLNTPMLVSCKIL